MVRRREWNFDRILIGIHNFEMNIESNKKTDGTSDS